MKTFRFIIAVVCTAGLATGSRAADAKADNASKLVGTWNLVKSNGKLIEKGDSETFEFTKDGKFKITKTKGRAMQTTDGDYKFVDGDTVVLTVKKNKDTLTEGFKIKTLTADTLTIGGGKGKEDEMEYKKK